VLVGSAAVVQAARTPSRVPQHSTQAQDPLLKLPARTPTDYSSTTVFRALRLQLPDTDVFIARQNFVD
jgi:hypothetical protein